MRDVCVRAYWVTNWLTHRILFTFRMTERIATVDSAPLQLFLTSFHFGRASILLLGILDCVRFVCILVDLSSHEAIRGDSLYLFTVRA